MEKLEMIPPTRTTADVLIVQFSRENLNHYLSIASALRTSGIATEVYPDAKKLGNQFKYADRRGFRAVIVAGEDELAAEKVQVKWMEDGSQQELGIADECAELCTWLSERLTNDR